MPQTAWRSAVGVDLPYDEVISLAYPRLFHQAGYPSTQPVYRNLGDRLGVDKIPSVGVLISRARALGLGARHPTRVLK